MVALSETRSSSSEQHIQVLETILQRTFAAHPHLKHWAFHENGISSADRKALSQYDAGPARDVSPDHRRKVAQLEKNRDKWRERANKLKDMCKQLQLRVQQGTVLASQTRDPLLEHTANLLPAVDIGIRHSNTQPLSRAELQELKGELLATAPATAGGGQAARTSIPSKDAPHEDRMNLPAAMETPKDISPGCGRTAYKSALKKNTSGTATSKKGVSLHESQNITHEFQDEAAAARNEQRVPSIMDMLQAGAPQCDEPTVQKPSLMDFLQQQEQQKQQTHQQDEDVKAMPSSAEKLLPCLLAVKTSLDAGGNTQVSLSIDDATRDVLTGLLKMTSTDELKSTPPLDFFAAAGLLDSFTYTPTDPKTPSYFKVVKSQAQNDEQSNPFARTGRIAIPHDDDDDDDGMDHMDDIERQTSNENNAKDSVSPYEVVGFACYDDSPKAPGSAMEMIQGGLAESDSDLTDHIFGPAAPAGRCNSDDEKLGVLERMFGGGAAVSSDHGSDTATEGVLDRIFGGSAAEEGASESGSDALIEGLAGRIFGGTTGAQLAADASAESPSVKDRVRSFEQMFGGGEIPADSDDLDANQAFMTSRIFGDAPPVAGGEQGRVNNDELDNARAGLTLRIFGNAERPAPNAGDGDVSTEMDDDRAALTQRIFGAASEPAAGASAEAVADDDRTHLAHTDRLNGTQEAAMDPAVDGDSAHHGKLEQRVFGISTLARAVGEKFASAGAGSTAAVVSKWQQQENTGAFHSTRIRAGDWLDGGDSGEHDTEPEDSPGQVRFSQGQGGNADRLQLPGGHAALNVAPYGF